VFPAIAGMQNVVHCVTLPWQAKTNVLMAILRDTLNSGQPNHGLAEARVGSDSSSLMLS